MSVFMSVPKAGIDLLLPQQKYYIIIIISIIKHKLYFLAHMVSMWWMQALFSDEETSQTTYLTMYDKWSEEILQEKKIEKTHKIRSPSKMV